MWYVTQIDFAKTFSAQMSIVIFNFLLLKIVHCSCASPGVLEKGFICIKVWGVQFADFLSFFLNISWIWNNSVSQRPNYFVFIGYLKTGERGSSKPLEPPLDPQLIAHTSKGSYFAFVLCWLIQSPFCKRQLWSARHRNTDWSGPRLSAYAYTCRRIL